MVSGASLAVQMLAEGMSKQGHHVLVLTSSNRPEPYGQRRGNLTIYYHRSFVNPFRVGQRFTVGMHHASMQMLDDFLPDIVHVHDPFQFAYTGLEYCRKKLIPIAITTHQLPWFVNAYLPEWLQGGNLVENSLWNYSSWLLRRFDIILSPTNTITNVIYEHTGVASHAINYGIESDYFHNRPNDGNVNRKLRKKFNIPPDVPVLLHVGRLDADKSVDIVVRAVAKSMSKNDAHFLLIGDGTEKIKLIALCEKLGIIQRSHFPGYIISRQELADVYRMATVFISASEIETQGIVLVEAAACGLPLVAVRATCIPEIVKDGKNGFLTPKRDIYSIADSLDKILSNREITVQMGEASNLISKKYSTQKMVDEHSSLYTKLESKHCSVSSQRIWQKLRPPFTG